MPMIDALPILGIAKAVPTSVAATDGFIIDVPQRGVGYVVTAVLAYNASGSNATATLSLYSGPGASGAVLVADAALTTHTTAAVVSSRTVAATATTPLVASDNIYVRVGTASGVAGSTIDVVVYGYALP